MGTGPGLSKDSIRKVMKAFVTLRIWRHRHSACLPKSRQAHGHTQVRHHEAEDSVTPKKRGIDMIDPLKNNFRCSVAWVQTRMCANLRANARQLQALTRAVLGNNAELVANPENPQNRELLWLLETLGSDRHSDHCPVPLATTIAPAFVDFPGLPLARQCFQALREQEPAIAARSRRCASATMRQNS
jgi:hypothetical protein